MQMSRLTPFARHDKWRLRSPDMTAERTKIQLMNRKPACFQLRNYYICDLNPLNMISKELVQCTEDMRQAAESGKITLDACVRAYDLLEKIMDLPDGGSVGPADIYSDTVATWCSTLGPAEEFCSEYRRLAPALESVYDEGYLKSQALERLVPYEKALEEAALRCAKKTTLHQCAKETFEIWNSGGLLARQRALRKLRSLAGFRLESNRIGNYVAKTFDLMNEAQAEYARAQQALFIANVSYKIKPGLYARIASALHMESAAGRTGRGSV